MEIDQSVSVTDTSSSSSASASAPIRADAPLSSSSSSTAPSFDSDEARKRPLYTAEENKLLDVLEEREKQGKAFDELARTIKSNHTDPAEVIRGPTRRSFRHALHYDDLVITNAAPDMVDRLKEVYALREVRVTEAEPFDAKYFLVNVIVRESQGRYKLWKDAESSAQPMLLNGYVVNPGRLRWGEGTYYQWVLNDWYMNHTNPPTPRLDKQLLEAFEDPFAKVSPAFFDTTLINEVPSMGNIEEQLKEFTDLEAKDEELTYGQRLKKKQLLATFNERRGAQAEDQVLYQVTCIHPIECTAEALIEFLNVPAPKSLQVAADPNAFAAYFESFSMWVREQIIVRGAFPTVKERNDEVTATIGMPELTVLRVEPQSEQPSDLPKTTCPLQQIKAADSWVRKIKGSQFDVHRIVARLPPLRARVQTFESITESMQIGVVPRPAESYLFSWPLEEFVCNVAFWYEPSDYSFAQRRQGKCMPDDPVDIIPVDRFTQRLWFTADEDEFTLCDRAKNRADYLEFLDTALARRIAAGFGTMWNDTVNRYVSDPQKIAPPFPHLPVSFFRCRSCQQLCYYHLLDENVNAKFPGSYLFRGLEKGDSASADASISSLSDLMLYCGGPECQIIGPLDPIYEWRDAAIDHAWNQPRGLVVYDAVPRVVSAALPLNIEPTEHAAHAWATGELRDQFSQMIQKSFMTQILSKTYLNEDVCMDQLTRIAMLQFWGLLIRHARQMISFHPRRNQLNTAIDDADAKFVPIAAKVENLCDKEHVKKAEAELVPELASRLAAADWATPRWPASGFDITETQILNTLIVQQVFNSVVITKKLLECQEAANKVPDVPSKRTAQKEDAGEGVSFVPRRIEAITTKFQTWRLKEATRFVKDVLQPNNYYSVVHKFMRNPPIKRMRDEMQERAQQVFLGETEETQQTVDAIFNRPVIAQDPATVEVSESVEEVFKSHQFKQESREKLEKIAMIYQVAQESVLALKDTDEGKQAAKIFGQVQAQQDRLPLAANYKVGESLTAFLTYSAPDMREQQLIKAVEESVSTTSESKAPSTSSSSSSSSSSAVVVGKPGSFNRILVPVKSKNADKIKKHVERYVAQPATLVDIINKLAVMSSEPESSKGKMAVDALVVTSSEATKSIGMNMVAQRSELSDKPRHKSVGETGAHETLVPPPEENDEDEEFVASDEEDDMDVDEEPAGKPSTDCRMKIDMDDVLCDRFIFSRAPAIQNPQELADFLLPFYEESAWGDHYPRTFARVDRFLREIPQRLWKTLNSNRWNKTQRKTARYYGRKFRASEDGDMSHLTDASLLKYFRNLQHNANVDPQYARERVLAHLKRRPVPTPRTAHFLVLEPAFLGTKAHPNILSDEEYLKMMQQTDLSAMDEYHKSGQLAAWYEDAYKMPEDWDKSLRWIHNQLDGVKWDAIHHGLGTYGRFFEFYTTQRENPLYTMAGDSAITVEKTLKALEQKINTTEPVGKSRFAAQFKAYADFLPHLPMYDIDNRLSLALLGIKFALRDYMIHSDQIRLRREVFYAKDAATKAIRLVDWYERECNEPDKDVVFHEVDDGLKKVDQDTWKMVLENKSLSPIQKRIAEFYNSLLAPEATRANKMLSAETDDELRLSAEHAQKMPYVQSEEFTPIFGDIEKFAETIRPVRPLKTLAYLHPDATSSVSRPPIESKVDTDEEHKEEVAAIDDDTEAAIDEEEEEEEDEEDEEEDVMDEEPVDEPADVTMADDKGVEPVSTNAEEKEEVKQIRYLQTHVVEEVKDIMENTSQTPLWKILELAKSMASSETKKSSDPRNPHVVRYVQGILSKEFSEADIEAALEELKPIAAGHSTQAKTEQRLLQDVLRTVKYYNRPSVKRRTIQDAVERRLNPNALNWILKDGKRVPMEDADRDWIKEMHAWLVRHFEQLPDGIDDPVVVELIGILYPVALALQDFDIELRKPIENKESLQGREASFKDALGRYRVPVNAQQAVEQGGKTQRDTAAEEEEERKKESLAEDQRVKIKWREYQLPDIKGFVVRVPMDTTMRMTYAGESHHAMSNHLLEQATYTNRAISNWVYPPTLLDLVVRYVIGLAHWPRHLSDFPELATHLPPTRPGVWRAFPMSMSFFDSKDATRINNQYADYFQAGSNWTTRRRLMFGYRPVTNLRGKRINIGQGAETRFKAAYTKRLWVYLLTDHLAVMESLGVDKGSDKGIVAHETTHLINEVAYAYTTYTVDFFQEFVPDEMRQAFTRTLLDEFQYEEDEADEATRERFQKKREELKETMFAQVIEEAKKTQDRRRKVATKIKAQQEELLVEIAQRKHDIIALDLNIVKLDKQIEELKETKPLDYETTIAGLKREKEDKQEQLTTLLDIIPMTTPTGLMLWHPVDLEAGVEIATLMDTGKTVEELAKEDEEPEDAKDVKDAAKKKAARQKRLGSEALSVDDYPEVEPRDEDTPLLTKLRQQLAVQIAFCQKRQDLAGIASENWVEDKTVSPEERNARRQLREKQRAQLKATIADLTTQIRELQSGKGPRNPVDEFWNRYSEEALYYKTLRLELEPRRFNVALVEEIRRNVLKETPRIREMYDHTQQPSSRLYVMHPRKTLEAKLKAINMTFDMADRMVRRDDVTTIEDVDMIEPEPIDVLTYSIHFYAGPRRLAHFIQRGLKRRRKIPKKLEVKPKEKQASSSSTTSASFPVPKPKEKQASSSSTTSASSAVQKPPREIPAVLTKQSKKNKPKDASSSSSKKDPSSSSSSKDEKKKRPKSTPRTPRNWKQKPDDAIKSIPWDVVSKSKSEEFLTRWLSLQEDSTIKSIPWDIVSKSTWEEFQARWVNLQPKGKRKDYEDKIQENRPRRRRRTKRVKKSQEDTDSAESKKKSKTGAAEEAKKSSDTAVTESKKESRSTSPKKKRKPASPKKESRSPSPNKKPKPASPKTYTTRKAEPKQPYAKQMASDSKDEHAEEDPEYDPNQPNQPEDEDATNDASGDESGSDSGSDSSSGSGSGSGSEESDEDESQKATKKQRLTTKHRMNVPKGTEV